MSDTDLSPDKPPQFIMVFGPSKPDPIFAAFVESVAEKVDREIMAEIEASEVLP